MPASLPERSRARVEDVLADLAVDHGEFETVERETSLPLSAYRSAVERFEDGRVGGASAWLTDPAGAVLLVRRSGGDAWTEPGDTQRPGETLAETARRAVADRMGLTADLTGVERARVFEYTPTMGDRPAVTVLTVVFAGTATGDPDPPPDDEAAWWTALPDRVGYEDMHSFPFPESGT